MPVTFYSGCSPCCPGAVAGPTASGNCCSGVGIPLALHATIFSGGALNGVYALNYSSGIPGWQTAGAVGTCGSGLRFVCTGSGVGFVVQKFNGFSWISVPTTGVSGICSPIDIHIANIGTGTCGAAGAFQMEVTT